MYNIDDIMDMLDWNQSKEEQEKGLKLAKNIKSINVFIQPLDPKHNKNVWENCAKVLSERSDEELKPYIISLLEWLQNMNWPGAFIIFERLKNYKDKENFDWSYYVVMNRAVKLNDEIWKDNLIELSKSLNFEL
mgnify:FL=1